MTRYVVTMTNGEHWELSATSSADAAARGVQSSARWGAGAGRAQIVQTLDQWQQAGREQFVRDLDALGAVVIGCTS